MKKFLLISLLLAMTGISFTQQVQPDRLLWHTGKLLKPNVLLTQNGDTVFYNPQKNQVRVMSQSGSGKKMDGMLAELNHTTKRIEEEIRKMSSAVPRHILPDLSATVTKAYKAVEDDWKSALSNTISLPQGPDLTQPQPIKTAGKGGPGIDWDEQEFSDPLVEELLKEIKAFKESHKEDQFSMLPVPPRYNFSYCYPCDSSAVNRYEKDKARFLAEMAGADTALMSKVTGINSTIQKKGLFAYPYYKNAMNELSEFMWYMMDRAAEKAIRLVEKYQDDPYRIPAVMSYWLPVERQVQLLGRIDNSPLQNHHFWEILLTTMDRFFADAMAQKDYSVGLNINAILGFERWKQLMGIKGSPLFLMVSDFNQFKIYSNITAKMGDESKGYIIGHARGDNWYHAIPDNKTCKLNWYLHGLPTDKPKYKLITGEMVGAPAEYIGTRDWMSEVPKINIEFCYKEGEEPADSITASTFHPENYKELWKFPPPTGVLDVTEIGGTFIGCFLDKERIQQDAEEMNREKIEQMKADFQNKYAKLAGADMKTISAAAMNSQAEMEKLNREIKELLLKNNPLRYIFTPQVHNKETVIFKEKLNGQEIFPDNAAIIYAFFHLTMEHDAGSGHELAGGFAPKK